MSETILIGKIVNVFGIHGEVKVYNYSGFDDRYENLERIIVDKEEIPILGVKHQKNMVILNLEGVDTRDAAERLRGKNVYMTEDDLFELPEGEFYIRDLIGMEVYNEETGERLGVLKDVLTDRPQDIYVVKLDQGGECMIPGVESFIRDIDGDARRIDVALIEGLIR